VVSPQPSGDEEQQPHFLHSPLVEVNSHDMETVHTSSPAKNIFMIYLWTMMLFNGPSLTIDANHVDNLPNYNLNSTTSCSSTPIPSPAIHYICLETLYAKKSPQTTSIFKSSIIESSLVSHSWYLEDSAQVWEGYAAKTIPKNQWFCRGCQRMKQCNTGKPVTLKPPVNIYPCGPGTVSLILNLLTYLLYSGEMWST